MVFKLIEILIEKSHQLFKMFIVTWTTPYTCHVVWDVFTKKLWTIIWVDFLHKHWCYIVIDMTIFSGHTNSIWWIYLNVATGRRWLVAVIYRKTLILLIFSYIPNIYVIFMYIYLKFYKFHYSWEKICEVCL